MNLNFGRCQPIDDVHGRPWSAPRSRKVYPMNVYLILGARKVRRMILASVACWAALFGCVAAAAETKPLRLQIDQDVSIQVRGHTIVTYRATPSPNRPFLRELWTPGGVQVLRDSPHDHKHHHGMMFALSVRRDRFLVRRADQRPSGAKDVAGRASRRRCGDITGRLHTTCGLGGAQRHGPPTTSP